MKTPAAVRFNYATVIAIFVFAIAAFAVPLRSVNSVSLIATPKSNDTKRAVDAKTSLFARSGNLSSRGSLAATLAVPVTETLATFSADCVTAKTSFVLGETVCVQVNADAGSLAFVNPAVLVESSVAITSNPQTATFTLPTATTQTRSVYTPALTFDNRGTWQIFLNGADGNLEYVAAITVHDPQTPIADLQVSKSPVINAIVNASSQLQVAIWVYNYGPDAAQNVQVDDSTASNTTFLSLVQTTGPTFNCTTPTVGAAGVSQCSRSSLNAGEAAGFIATYAVNSNIGNGTALTGSATASTTTAERTTSDNNSSSTATGSNPTPPSCTLSCPGNVTATAPLGQSAATVNFDEPTTSGTCGSVSATPTSGSFFAIGTTVVTASTEDGESCSFLVTVNAAEDNEDPTITCPSDITVDESSSSANSATVNYNVTATDNSGSASVSCNPPSGSSFPTGTHQVICTATDAAGNSASCNFNVTVNQVGCDLDANSPPPTPNVASLPSITRACSVTLLPADDPSATDACGGTISGETNDPREYDSPGTYTVQWTYTDSAGHTTTQNQTIVIQPDNSAPVPDVASLPTVTGECTASIDGDPPTATDNCGGSGIVGTPLDPLSYNTAGTYTVRWQFTDAAGNSAIQNQTVVVTDTSAPVVNLTGPSTVTVECHTSYTDAGATATDNCSPTPSTTSNSNVEVNTPGTYQVVWTATDAGGNTASATRTVVVVDTIAPVIALNGASPLTVECHTSFTDPGATASDSCDTNVPVNVSGTVNADVVGTYTLVYTAADDSGNAATSVSRTVNVVDTTAPTISCPANIVVYLPLNSTATSMPVSFAAPTATDSCDSSVPVTSSHASGSVFPVGSTTVTTSASDDSGNSVSCAFTVTVLYNFTGFFNPVSNPPVFNNVNAGRAIPLKFSLSGDKGLNIFAAGYPASQQIACDSSAPVSELEGTVTSGGSTLTYSADQYHYSWKTESSWAGTCRVLVVKLNDGTEHTALFKFK